MVLLLRWLLGMADFVKGVDRSGSKKERDGAQAMEFCRNRRQARRILKTRETCDGIVQNLGWVSDG